MATTSTRTPDQTHNAIFWQSAGGPALLWNGVARNLAEDPAHALDIADSCASARDDEPERRGRGDQLLERQVPLRLLAALACDPPGGPRTAIPRRRADPSWTPLLTAPYPEHPSGHMCLDGAHLRVLQMFFGTDDDALRRHQQPVPRDSRARSTAFSAPLEEITEARIWAGLHFRTADVQGQDLGINVAEYMADNYFQPVGRG